VSVAIGDGSIIIRSADGAASETWPFSVLSSAVPLNRSAQDVLLARTDAPGVSLYVGDPDFARQLRESARHLSVGRERMRAAWPGLLVGAAVLVVAAAVWLLQFSPAKTVARALPESAKAAIGRQLIESFARDHKVCRGVAGNAALAKIKAQLAIGLPASQSFDVTILDWSLVNAFAVPGGRVVITSGLLQQARSADEIAGVLAHEIGHTVELHPEAGLVRGVGLWALVQFVFAGSSGTLGNFGMALAQLSYAREAEREADQVGLELLRKAAISPQPLMDFFTRMEGEAPSSTRGRVSRAWDILSTHPPNPERIENIRRIPSYETRPVLDATSWEALRNTCKSE